MGCLKIIWVKGENMRGAYSAPSYTRGLMVIILDNASLTFCITTECFIHASYLKFHWKELFWSLKDIPWQINYIYRLLPPPPSLLKGFGISLSILLTGALATKIYAKTRRSGGGCLNFCLVKGGGLDSNHPLVLNWLTLIVSGGRAIYTLRRKI